MKNILMLLLAALFGSCQYFDNKVPSEDELLQKKLEEINWKEVTTYPSVAECDSILDKELKKECFFSSMTRIVQEKLAVDSLAGLTGGADTINVKVTVNPDSTLEFEPQFPEDSTAYNKIKIDSVLKARLVDFPAIEPAQKEGVPVKTQFILPVILSVE
jgi:hypothetical protein